MMIRTQVYLPEDLHIDLKLLAKQGKTNYSSLIREGVKEVIKKKRKQIKKNAWKSLMGSYKDKIKIVRSVDPIRDYYLNDVI